MSPKIVSEISIYYYISEISISPQCQLNVMLNFGTVWVWCTPPPPTPRSIGGGSAVLYSTAPRVLGGGKPGGKVRQPHPVPHPLPDPCLIPRIFSRAEPFRVLGGGGRCPALLLTGIQPSVCFLPPALGPSPINLDIPRGVRAKEFSSSPLLEPLAFFPATKT